MRVVASGGLQDRPVVTDASTVVVYDQYDNPITVVVEVRPGVYTYAAANDPDFNRILSGLGIDKVVVNTELSLDKDVPENAKLLSGPFGEVS